MVEDTLQPEQNKPWVILAPPESNSATLLLGRATNEAQQAAIGNQSGGRVFLFLSTDDFWRDYQQMRQRGVVFVREPAVQRYGTVAAFKDWYGILWDLVELGWSSQV